jgi:hypothetical protein
MSDVFDPELDWIQATAPHAIAPAAAHCRSNMQAARRTDPALLIVDRQLRDGLRGEDIRTPVLFVSGLRRGTNIFGD